ncbi:endo-1,4-beta-xylanase [Tundrisphaera sp. TA3]|uniref:endo-1,4-beta-xylanase n=1 Tax=Tundrisphaera sp. TA3 TaxID=3435775 RepID=UPI003EBE8E08
MGSFRFRLGPSLPEPRQADLRRAYVTGLDRTPSRVGVDIRKDVLTVQKGTTESGRLYVPWPVPGSGVPLIGTATLGDRNEPYNLAVELARGRLNDVRNQLSDWRQMGLKVGPDLERLVAASMESFTRAATSRDRPDVAFAAAQECLSRASAAGDALVAAYVDQVLQIRLAAGKLPTLLALGLDGDPAAAPWASKMGATFGVAQLHCPWKALAPHEGRFRFEDMDAQVVWATRQKMALHAGPLIDLRPGAMPDWIWLWQGDFDAILGMAIDVVRQTVARFKGKITTWHLVNRPGTTDILGMTEEDQIRLTARLLQVARQADPAAQFLVGFDRPWSEWMGSSSFQLGPLHLADYLARAELGMAGLVLEVAPGYSAPGSHYRELLDFSRMLDLYALLNYPLHLSFAFPSSSAPDPKAEANVAVEKDQWPSPPDEAMQASVAARWISLAVAKPFVRSVTWRQAYDGAPHLYPHAGLIRPDQTPKPVLEWIKAFRADFLP